MSSAFDDGFDVPEQDRLLARLIGDAEAAAGPVAWPRVESLVTALLDMYGRAFQRILIHARAVAGTRHEELDARLQRDALVESLLALHALHPVPVEERIARALELVRAQHGDAAPLALVEIQGDTVTLRADGDLPPPPAQAVARAIDREAPELAGVRVLRAGVEVPAERTPTLIPLDRLRRAGPP